MRAESYLMFWDERGGSWTADGATRAGTLKLGGELVGGAGVDGCGWDAVACGEDWG